ncbi:probable disease resistance protein At1g58602 [Citrus clementina]|nr:probable disease resistance protein At1g58602 [Citrus x clementina]
MMVSLSYPANGTHGLLPRVRLWVAEDFIPEEKEDTENVAEEYLKELIDRSMIQITERYLDKVKTCRSHDLIRELAIKKDMWDAFDARNLIDLQELEIREIPYTNMNFILQLEGKIDILPRSSDEFPPNLSVLVLYGLLLKEDSIPILEMLSSLTILHLGNDSFSGKKMVFSMAGFPQLQVLRLSWLRLLETLVVESEAMPRLKYFSIEDCNNQLMVPERLRMLPLPLEW